jgi:hypothetical protein
MPQLSVPVVEGLEGWIVGRAAGLKYNRKLGRDGRLSDSVKVVETTNGKAGIVAKVIQGGAAGDSHAIA